MKEAHGQDNQAYGKLVGELLTDGVAAQQTTGQQQAMRELGSYLRTARTFHGRATTALADELGLDRDELHALEQGLLPYQRMTTAFLHKVAQVYQEDVTLLQTLLDATQHQFAQQVLLPRAPQQALSIGRAAPATDESGTAIEAVQRGWPRWWRFVTEFVAECRGQTQQLRKQLSLPDWGGMNLHTVQPVLLTMLLIAIGYSYLQVDHAADVGWSGAPAERTTNTAVPAPSTTARGETASRAQPLAGSVAYQIVDRQEWEMTANALPAIPVQDDQIALLEVRQVIPKIVQRCHIISHQDSCPT